LALNSFRQPILFTTFSNKYNPNEKKIKNNLHLTVMPLIQQVETDLV